jgi:hypothetical protein
MCDTLAGEVLDLSTLRLERAAKRLEAQDHGGAMRDLRAALHHMRKAGADPVSIQFLTSLITDEERHAS